MLVSFVLALAASAAVHPAPIACPAATALFADVRAHTGGARWDTAREVAGEGTVTASGLSGRMIRATDLASGATSTTDELPLAREHIVSSARGAWKQDLTLGVHRLDAPDARAAARTSAYLARNGFFRPATDPARFACLPEVREDGRTLRRVSITPLDGRPVSVWVDPAAHVLVRTQQQAPIVLETVHYGAYRRTAGLLLPHEIVETDGRPEGTVVRSIAAYTVARSVRASDFERPKDPANQRIAGGASSTRVQIDVANGSPVVEAYVDGKGPLPFILDTGGHAILTADAAKQLGLTAVGGGASGGAGEGTVAQQYAHVRSLRIGGAEISDFPMYVIAYDKQFSDRGPAKPPLAGILGLEVFERFAVTVDYAHRSLQLQMPEAFTPRAGDVAVPLYFDDDMPLAYASADGARGLFGIDTGNSGRPILFDDYLSHNGLLRHYTQGAAAQGMGTGGAVQFSTHRLRALLFGGLTMHNFPAGFVAQKKGSFSSRAEAGNIGHDVLSQFTLTTDYRRGRMYLHRESGAPLPVLTRSGLIAGSRDADGRVVVQGTVPNSPAAEAGIAKDDVIVAVDGTGTETLTPPQFAALARRPVGTLLHLTVKTAGAQRDVILTLRELLCNPGASRCGAWVEPTHAVRSRSTVPVVGFDLQGRADRQRDGPVERSVRH